MWIYTTTGVLVQSEHIAVVRHDTDNRCINAVLSAIDVDGPVEVMLVGDLTPLEAECVLKNLPQWLRTSYLVLDLNQWMRQMRGEE